MNLFPLSSFSKPTFLLTTSCCNIPSWKTSSKRTKTLLLDICKFFLHIFFHLFFLINRIGNTQGDTVISTCTGIDCENILSTIFSNIIHTYDSQINPTLYTIFNFEVFTFFSRPLLYFPFIDVHVCCLYD